MKIEKKAFLKISAAGILAVLFGAGLIVYPQTAALGMKEGIKMCLTVIIPSLFPFLVLSSFVVQSGLSARAGKLLGKITKKLFKLPGAAGGAIIMSFMGGYPIGAQMTSELLKQNSITRGQAQRMILFCVNCGPAFVISAVGSAMLGSKQAGVILFISLTLSSVLVGFMSRFLNEYALGNKITDSFNAVSATKNAFLSPAAALSASVSKSITSMLGICAWVVLFRCAGELMTVLHISNPVLILLQCVTEVTTGCAAASSHVPLSALAAVLGWGGLSVHCQILPFIEYIGIRPSVFLTARIVNGVLGALICNGVIRLFPCNLPALATDASLLPSAVSVSIPAAAGVLFMCAVFILDVDTKAKT